MVAYIIFGEIENHGSGCVCNSENTKFRSLTLKMIVKGIDDLGKNLTVFFRRVLNYCTCV